MMADFLLIIVFVAAYLGGHLFAPAGEAIYWATGLMMAAALLQLLYLNFIRKRKIERKVLLTNVAVMALGSLTFIFHSPLIIKLKPTIVNFIFALLFALSPILFRENLTQKMLQSAFQLPEALWQKLNWAWVSFFVFLGILNAFVAYSFSEVFWLGFKFWGLMGLSLIFILLHVYLFRDYLKKDEL